MARTIFFISDGTGITAETLGRSLLSQFEDEPFEYVTIPYVNNPHKVQDVLAKIDAVEQQQKERPIVFITMVNTELRKLFNNQSALYIDFFQTFIDRLEKELGVVSSRMVGKSHGIHNLTDYMARINAVNYALAYDDGLNPGNYHHADVILMGVSRCGKTPTCLFLGMQYGVFAANYPITTEELDVYTLPSPLQKFQHKIVGLTIKPDRLAKIRQERLPNRKYAQLKQCETELRYAEAFFKKNQIPYLDTTTRSIEELAAEIMSIAHLKRRIK